LPKERIAAGFLAKIIREAVVVRKGVRVGLMDVDVHGPDIPTILGLKGVLEASVDGRIIPKPCSENLEVISVGSMAGDQDNPVPAGDP
jgi:Mrp family chromosome partitioning ATPase